MSVFFFSFPSVKESVEKDSASGNGVIESKLCMGGMILSFLKIVVGLITDLGS